MTTYHDKIAIADHYISTLNEEELKLLLEDIKVAEPLPLNPHEVIRDVVLIHFNLTLEEFLSQQLGTKVDLVTKSALKPLLKNQILKETVYA